MVTAKNETSHQNRGRKHAEMSMHGKTAKWEQKNVVPNELTSSITGLLSFFVTTPGAVDELPYPTLIIYQLPS